MTRAEEAALKAYPKQDKYSEYLDGSNALKQEVFIQGYSQAGKDNALSWEDIERIEHYCEQVNREHNMGTFRGTPYGKSFYKEVARRFNKGREEKQ